MNTGIKLDALSQRILADRALSKDYIGSTSLMEMSDDGHLMLQNGERLSLGVRRIAHEQIAEKTGIPFKYYERMKTEQPALLARNVNAWFAREPSKRLVRTINGEARAFLGEGYRPLDNYDVATHLLPRMSALGLEVVSSQITESRLYIQSRSPRVQGDVRVGDTVQSGVVVSNSEVGRGSLSIAELDFRLWCLNGAVGENVIRQTHVGGVRKGDVTFAQEVTYSEGTQRKVDAAFWAMATEAITHALSPERFEVRLQRMKRAAGVEIAKPAAVVEKITELLGLTEPEGAGVLEAFAKGGDITQWGLANAVTAQAKTEKDYDRSVEFEKLGTRILELPAATFDLN